MKSNQSAKAMKTTHCQPNAIVVEMIIPEGIVIDDITNTICGAQCPACHRQLTKEEAQALEDIIERQEKVDHIATNVIDIIEGLENNESIILDALIDALASYYIENHYDGEDGDIEFLLSRVAEEASAYADTIDELMDLEDDDEDQSSGVPMQIITGYMDCDEYNRMCEDLGIPQYRGDCKHVKVECCNGAVLMTPHTVTFNDIGGK